MRQHEKHFTYEMKVEFSTSMVICKWRTKHGRNYNCQENVPILWITQSEQSDMKIEIGILTLLWTRMCITEMLLLDGNTLWQNKTISLKIS